MHYGICTVADAISWAGSMLRVSSTSSTNTVSAEEAQRDKAERTIAMEQRVNINSAEEINGDLSRSSASPNRIANSAAFWVPELVVEEHNTPNTSPGGIENP